jgi:hypothetical protein
MNKKTVIIKVELVTESLAEPDEKIVKELFDWFREEVIYIPWVKEVKEITVKD